MMSSVLTKTFHVLIRVISACVLSEALKFSESGLEHILEASRVQFSGENLSPRPQTLKDKPKTPNLTPKTLFPKPELNQKS